MKIGIHDAEKGLRYTYEDLKPRMSIWVSQTVAFKIYL